MSSNLDAIPASSLSLCSVRDKSLAFFRFDESFPFLLECFSLLLESFPALSGDLPALPLANPEGFPWRELNEASLKTARISSFLIGSFVLSVFVLGRMID